MHLCTAHGVSSIVQLLQCKTSFLPQLWPSSPEMNSTDYSTRFMESYNIMNMSCNPAILKKSGSKWLISGKPLTQHLKGAIFAFPCWPLSGHGQGYMSNFYILDLENFATASRQCTGVINVDGPLVDYAYYGKGRRGWMHKFVIRWSTVTHCVCVVYCNPLTPLLQFVLDLSYKLHYTVMQQSARIRLTRCIAQSVCDSRASCSF